jgi:hypothetical protein
MLEMGTLEIFAWAGLKSTILLISAPLAARITGMSQEQQNYLEFIIYFAIDPNLKFYSN